MTALVIDGLRKTFGGVKAVRDLSFTIEPGSVTGLMGPNGAGKSTVLDLVCGVTKPDAGSISIFGEDTAGLRADQVTRLGVARTYQVIRLTTGLTAVQQVITGCYLQRETSLLASILQMPWARQRRREIEDIAMYLLDRVGMADRADILSEAMSYGEQRRVEIARALGSNPMLLLLDEPTAGMNVQEADRIGTLIQALRDDGLSILLVEHSMRMVADYCDHAVVMNFGAKITEGPPADCLDDEKVQDAYFGRQRDADSQ